MGKQRGQHLFIGADFKITTASIAMDVSREFWTKKNCELWGPQSIS